MKYNQRERIWIWI